MCAPRPLPPAPLLLLSLLLLLPRPAAAQCDTNPNATAVYALTLQNFASNSNFSVVPEPGLNFSPPVAIAHANRITFFLLRARASRPVEIIAEQGVNTPLVYLARSLIPSRLVKSVVDFGQPTLPGTEVTVNIRVDCERPFVSFVSMLAPSPDWIVAVAREQLVNANGRFRARRQGPLFTYDAGTDSGGDFTPPADLSLDIPTVPQQNIAPLVEDETDVFDGQAVGFYILRRVSY